VIWIHGCQEEWTPSIQDKTYVGTCTYTRNTKLKKGQKRMPALINCLTWSLGYLFDLMRAYVCIFECWRVNSLLTVKLRPCKFGGGGQICYCIFLSKYSYICVHHGEIRYNHVIQKYLVSFQFLKDQNILISMYAWPVKCSYTRTVCWIASFYILSKCSRVLTPELINVVFQHPVALYRFDLGALAPSVRNVVRYSFFGFLYWTLHVSA
jgi:hypothetical protein